MEEVLDRVLNVTEKIESQTRDSDDHLSILFDLLIYTWFFCTM